MRDGVSEDNILLLSTNRSNYYNYSIKNELVSGPLSLEITEGDILCDAVVWGDIAVISNFGKGLFFIDISNPESFTLLGSIDIPDFFEEDIDITPDGKYVLVTDGGFGNTVHVVSAITREYVGSLEVSSSQAVAVSSDGKTVLVVDYNTSSVLSLNIDNTGTLTNTGIVISDCTGAINITISPNGKTGLVSSRGKVNVLLINSPTDLQKKNDIIIGEPGDDIQSIAFNTTGNKAYAVSKQGILYELNVNGSGNVTYSGRLVNLSKNLNTFFGIDQITISKDGNKAYIGGMSTKLSEVDLSTMTLIKEIEILPSGDYFTGIVIY